MTIQGTVHWTVSEQLPSLLLGGRLFERDLQTTDLKLSWCIAVFSFASWREWTGLDWTELKPPEAHSPARQARRRLAASLRLRDRGFWLAALSCKCLCWGQETEAKICGREEDSGVARNGRSREILDERGADSYYC